MNAHLSHARAPESATIDNPLEFFFSPQSSHQLIAEAAYYRAERRGFNPGHELEDWLAAEHDVNVSCGWIDRNSPAVHPNRG